MNLRAAAAISPRCTAAPFPIDFVAQKKDAMVPLREGFEHAPAFRARPIVHQEAAQARVPHGWSTRPTAAPCSYTGMMAQNSAIAAASFQVSRRMFPGRGGVFELQHRGLTVRLERQAQRLAGLNDALELDGPEDERRHRADQFRAEFQRPSELCGTGHDGQLGEVPLQAAQVRRHAQSDDDAVRPFGTVLRNERPVGNGEANNVRSPESEANSTAALSEMSKNLTHSGGRSGAQAPAMVSWPPRRKSRRPPSFRIPIQAG